MEGPDIHLGDRVQLRKPHPCGANHWTVVRIGADIRVRCDRCGRAVLMPRADFIRARRKLLASGGRARTRQPDDRQ